MIRSLAVAVAVLVGATSVACFHPQNDLRGQCSSDTDCGPGARCDKTVSPPVCVASTCSPACDSSSVCDTQSVTCKPVTTASIVVTTPAANAFVGGKVQVTATARAPGGVTGVTFHVKNGAGTVIGTGSGTAVPGSADFSANLTLGPAGLGDGPATVAATLTYPGGTLPSEIVPVTIDVTPPVVTSLQVFVEGEPVATAQGVTYPGQPPGATDGFLSAHDKTQFSLNDRIHIKGTVTDAGAGLSCSSLQYRIDGVDRNAAVVRGPSTQSLTGCSADGTGTVNFEASSVAINDLTKYGPLGAGTGNLQVVVLANDRITGAPNVTSENPLQIKVTRFWWSREFTATQPAIVTVGGLAIYPNGDVIVTTDTPGSVQTVFALHRDGPFHSPTGEDWGAQVGAVSGGPAIGASLMVPPPIYIADTSNEIKALSSTDGAPIWSLGGLGAFLNSPAVIPGSRINSITDCEAVVAGADTVLFAACQNPAVSITPTSAAVDVINKISSTVTVGGGNIFVGTDKSVARTAFRLNGLLSAPIQFAPGGAGPFTGALVTSSAAVFAGSVTDHTLYGVAFVTSTAPAFSPLFTPKNVLSAPLGMAIFSSPSDILFNTTDSRLHKMTTAGADNVFASLLTSGGTPLLGHDGVTYVGRGSGISAVDAAGTAAWNITPPVNVNTLTLDCAGTLYAAGGNTVYAIVTDMMSDPNNAGLADTPWPKFQRDSRNTGNADITTKFGVRTAPGPGGCTQ